MLLGLFWVVFSRVVSLGDGGMCAPVCCSNLANLFKFLHQSTHRCSIDLCYLGLVQDALDSAPFESFTAGESVADGHQRDRLNHGSNNLFPSRHLVGWYYQSLGFGFCDRRIGSLPCADFGLHIE